jgi:uncharacterized surface protein with fasciclin (FAS1) repeats
MLTVTRAATLSCCLILLLSGPAAGLTSDQGDIVDTAISAGSFETLVAAVKAAGLVEILKGEGPFTVFAPTDEAFAKLPEETLQALLLPENKAKLQSILTYHVVSGRVTSSDVVKLQSARTVQGQGVSITIGHDTVMLNEARVIKTDIETTNGIIHVIDSVIQPKDIVDFAISAGSFKTLIAAVKAADLVETLKGDGPFTLFAPTDEAFAKLTPGTLQELLLPANKMKLQNILTYHVVSGAVLADDVVKLKSAKTVNGQKIRIRIDKDEVRIDNATVVQTDLKVLNGVIHVIDSVILPKSSYSKKY